MTAIRSVTTASREGLALATPGRQACVFLDRDGVLNTTDGFVNRPEDLDRQLMPEALRALARLTAESDVKVVLITNQGGVGSGKMSESVCRQILERLAQRVEEAGGRMDALYFCPNQHGVRLGPGEVDARKPEAGMFLQAAQDFGPAIDLSDSYMIGDMTTDIASGEAATPAMTTILVETGFAGKDGKVDIQADHVSKDLTAAVEWILEEEGRR